MLSESYWMHTAPARSFPTLERDLSTDVAIIGGGIAGLCTAWELARAGVQVTVLEADRIAAGVTGYTTAKLTALHALLYSGLGPADARLHATAQWDAIEHVATTALQLGIDCDFERVPAFTYTETGEHLDAVRKEAEAAAAAGLDAQFVTTTGLPFPVAGAVRVDNQAQFHPRRYLLGLADAIVKAGGAIYENTRMESISKTISGYSVSAGEVVIATNYPIVNRPNLFPRLVPHREFVVAGLIANADDPQGMYITPENNTRSVRTAPYDADHRLLIVTGEHFTPGTAGTRERLDALTTWAQDRFRVKDIAFRWAAQDPQTTDRLPFTGRLSDHLWVATGFGGWGMTNGVMSGKLLAGAITGEPQPWASLYDPQRFHPTREVGRLLKTTAAVAGHYVGDRLHPSPVPAVSELAPGTAAILRHNGTKCAAFRDDDGTVHLVSATCTHMGCVVGFNDVERTWECPCHGSRFGIDGEVLQGPALHPLKLVDQTE